MKLTSHNLEKHRALFAEVGPNRAVIVRERCNPDAPGHRDVCAESFRLLEDHADHEGWKRSDLYCPHPTVTVDELLGHCPELARYHFIPADWVDVW